MLRRKYSEYEVLNDVYTAVESTKLRSNHPREGERSRCTKERTEKSERERKRFRMFAPKEEQCRVWGLREMWTYLRSLFCCTVCTTAGELVLVGGK